MTSLDNFVRTAPSAKTALDIFTGEWNSILPGEPGLHVQGQFDTFRAPSISWGVPTLGGVDGKDVLELGPLEGGNSFMLSELGARSVIAVETNPRAFLRCLVVKELYNLSRVRFLCGDCSEYLRICNRPFDLCVANGILYHMRDPMELIRLISLVTDRVLLCTHYYDDAVIAKSPIANRFSSHLSNAVDGFVHTLHRYDYDNAHASANFSGGNAHFSNWLSRADILDGLRHFGFLSIDVNFEDPTYAYGPAFTVAASKQKPKQDA